MTRYHINYDGKILPCRAKVKKCPYEDARHGNSYEELYPIVMSNYNSTPSDPSLVKKLQSGETIGSLEVISSQLEDSRAPMETMIATLGLALANVDSGDLPHELKRTEKRAVDLCYKLFERNASIPSFVPVPIKNTAHEKWVSEGCPQVIQDYNKGGFENKGIRDQLEALSADEMREISKWRRSHTQLDPELKKNYREALTTDYNNYSRALNTSKLLTQSTEWTQGKSQEEIQASLKQMTGVELLSMYDDLTVADDELKESIRASKNFRYQRRTDVSEAANDNIERWYTRNQERARRMLVNSSQRILLSMNIANELKDREINFGDNIRISKTEG